MVEHTVPRAARGVAYDYTTLEVQVGTTTTTVPGTYGTTPVW